MNKNQILRVAIWIINVTIALVFLTLIGTLAMLVHWHFDKSYYDHVYLVNGFKAGLDTINLTLSDAVLTNQSLGSLSPSNLYWLVLRSVIILILGLYILRVLLQIVKSIKNMETFYIQNIKSFNKLAFVGILSSLIVFFNFEFVSGEVNWHFTIPLPQILATAICLILREVFKEGMKLYKDSATIV